MMLETAAALAVPWFGGQLASNVLSGDRLRVEFVLAALLLLFAAQALIKFFNRYILARTGQKILADLKIRVHDHIQALPLNFFHARPKGDVLAIMMYEVSDLCSFLTGTLLSLIPLSFAACGAALLMFRIDPVFAGLTLVLIPLFFLLLKFIGRKLRPLAQQFQQAHAATVATAEENLGMLPAIKAFTREPIEAARYSEQVNRVRQITTHQHCIHAALEPSFQFLAATAVLGLLWFMSDRLIAGDMAPSELVTFLLYGALLTRPVGGLASAYGKTQKARGQLERLQAVLNEQPEPVFDRGRALRCTRGEIEFCDVSFAYPDRPATLKHLTTKIEAGENRRDYWRKRGGQEHSNQFASEAICTRLREDIDRWHRHQHCHPAQSTQSNRHRSPTHVARKRHGLRKYWVRKTQFSARRY